MITRLEEEKVIRDPIHEYIHVNYKIIWDCINAKEFQRLRRIHQLGATFQVYPTAEHSRFSHSLGVYEIVRRMISEIKELDAVLKEEEKIVVLLAGLLHDIGHGPFSHSFEYASGTNHEEFTLQIVLEDSEIHQILFAADETLPKQVAAVISHTHSNELLCQLISGQLDADRMDYLLRDAYFTGTSYGEFDLGRILRTLRVSENKLVVKESGMHAIEDYIMARYHMYWQVYYHPISRSYEAILTMIFKRLKDLYQEYPTIAEKYPMFQGFLTEERMSIHTHFLLDEPACFHGFSNMRESEDEILKDLAIRLLDRKLFGYEDLAQTSKKEVKQLLIEKGYSSEYYLYMDSPTQKPYKPYNEQEQTPIWVITKEQTIKELSEVSEIVNSITKGKSKKDEKIFFPSEIKENKNELSK